MMNRRAFLAALSGVAGAAMPRPNVVLILADDMGWGDVAMNGCPDVATPHIDSIARQGVRLTQFYANAPECTPTRCALLTGRYQHRVGGLECAIGVNNLGRYDEAEWLQKKGELGLPVGELTLARLLRGGGYDTACFGKWHLGYMAKFGPLRHGFDAYFGILGGNSDYFTHEEMGEGAGHSQLYEGERPVQRKGYLTDLFTDAAVEWLGRRRQGKPFFLYLPYTAPHTPIQDPDASAGAAPYRDRHRPTFAKMVERLDACVGRVLRQLETMGAAENTLLLFLSDNGGDPNGRNAPYRGLKSSVFEGGIRVPCAMRWPGRIAAGGTVGQVSLTMDLLPTIAAATGVRVPAGRRLDGMDLLPFVRDGRAAEARTVFWRYKRGKARRKAVREGDWKYIDDSGKQYLFDLAGDEQEKRDLLAERPDMAARLRSLLARWEEDVRAPRLAGFSAP